MERVVVLCNVRSVHNVGSIFRTADGAGFSKIILCGVTPEPVDRLGRLRPQFAKVALGAERGVWWEKQRSAVRVIRELRRRGFITYAVEQTKGAADYRSAKRNAPRIALVLGSEATGLPRDVLRMADAALEIPMFGAKESLNVSVAFGVVAYHFAPKKREGRV